MPGSYAAVVTWSIPVTNAHSRHRDHHFAEGDLPVAETGGGVDAVMGGGLDRGGRRRGTGDLRAEGGLQAAEFDSHRAGEHGVAV